jgi:hypothetical protein
MGILEYLNRPKKQKAGLTYNEKEHRFVITFDPDISKAEFMEVWSRFAEARKKTIGKSHVKKINQPKDIDLLLGIHFLRLFGITYKNIHQAYINKEVPHYNGNYHFLTEFDLQKYYKRNIGKIKDI